MEQFKKYTNEIKKDLLKYKSLADKGMKDFYENVQKIEDEGLKKKYIDIMNRVKKCGAESDKEGLLKIIKELQK